MSDSKSRSGDVIGWFGAAGATAIATPIVGLYTGSLDVVAEFVVEHTAEAILWIVAVFVVGVFLGIAIRSHLAAKDLSATKLDCEQRIYEATMPLDRTIKLTKAQAELVVEMIERDRAGDSSLLMAKRGGDAVIDSLAEKGVFHKEPFGAASNMYNYAMDPEWLALFRSHEAEVRDIASR